MTGNLSQGQLQIKDVIVIVEKFLLSYLHSNLPRQKVLPTVVQCAEAVNLSNNYLSDLLKKETKKHSRTYPLFFIWKRKLIIKF